MISPYLSHIHITSQTFTVSNIPGGFINGLIRSCITSITSKTLLNGSTLHGTDIRHIFFKPNMLCSCRRRSIIQCSMCNQCTDLFTYIMNYLHVLIYDSHGLKLSIMYDSWCLFMYIIDYFYV
jgi:hypothetical protein